VSTFLLKPSTHVNITLNGENLLNIHCVEAEYLNKAKAVFPLYFQWNSNDGGTQSQIVVMV
jgi:hypothetical protein